MPTMDPHEIADESERLINIPAATPFVPLDKSKFRPTTLEFLSWCEQAQMTVQHVVL